ncbi:MAG: LytTR family transcriptional regulator [Oscillospiraceae bacterium]|nr:LytTR family transcriptional regulator [Oscillospiraceae bacterium]
MKIIITDPAPGEEDTVTISVKCMSDNIVQAISLLKNAASLTVYQDDKALMLPVADIFYVESVDLKTFVYAEKAVYRSRLKLYEAEELLGRSDFLRISKQTIVNVRKIKSVKPAGDGRFQAELVNGEKVIISRQYVPALKERFGL